MKPEQWHRVKEVFEAALEREPEQRSAFLGEACAGDDSLHDEVKSLLSSYEQESQFMETPAAALAAQSLVREESAALVGQQLGHYQITGELGRGGMGVVYLAQDTRLDRPVALKLLPTHLTSDPDRLRRFEREARAASALNHPNILTIHEIGQLDSLHFIETEFVDGMTLRERIKSKDLKLSEALNIAEQMASALAAAHEAGIVHRDIKPENVMLRRDGYVKVLDFGLAKLTEQQSVDVMAASTTVAGMNTDTGIAGTAGYMAPEQAQGLSVDQRTDIFSLGVVLYEMVTGCLPFEAGTPTDALVSMMKEEPRPLAHYVPKAAAKLQSILNKALRKNRDERYQSIAELMTDLKSVQSERTGFTARRLSFLAAALALMIGGPIWFYASRHTAKPSPPPMKVVPFTSLPGNEVFPAFSPDGKKIAFTWSGEKNEYDIYIKPVDGGPQRRLTNNPAPDLCPVWSPDGAYIAFSRLSETDAGIFITPATGGAERKVYSTTWNDPRYACIDWSPDGKSLAFQDRGAPQEPSSIFLLSLETLKKRKLTSPPEPHWNGDRNPVFSPDGKTLAFLRDSSVDTEDIYLVPVASGETRRLTFDNAPLSRMDWTSDGTEIVFPSPRGNANVRLWKVAISGGAPEPAAVGGEGTIALTVSRHGNRLAYAKASQGTDDIWRIELSKATGRGSSPLKFIASTRDEETPKYSPDGRSIAFASDRSGSMEIWRCDSDGSNLVQLTNFGGPLGGGPRWSPDGRWIAFDSRPEGHSQIYVINAEGGQPRRITTGKSDDIVPSWSKDGKWIYFSSNRGGEQQMWKVRAEGGEAVRLTGRAGFWGEESPDGKFFYYEAKTGEIWSIWRIPVNGDLGTPVVKLGHWGSFGWSGGPADWAVVESGIYFVSPENWPQRDIKFFSFATGQLKQIFRIGKERGLPGLAVSPDGRWILYTQLEGGGGSDIMLVENFR